MKEDKTANLQQALWNVWSAYGVNEEDAGRMEAIVNRLIKEAKNKARRQAQKELYEQCPKPWDSDKWMKRHWQNWAAEFMGSLELDVYGPELEEK